MVAVLGLCVTLVVVPLVVSVVAALVVLVVQ